jgi:hypothetical protein
MLDATGRVLRQHGVIDSPIECLSGDCPDVIFIEELLPDIPGIDRIELRLDTLLLDTWHVSRFTVSHTTTAKVTRTPTGVIVRWPRLAAAAGTQRYRVEESLDGGTTWFLLAIERGSPGIELDRALYAGVGSILIRVIDDAGTDSKEVARATVAL